MNNHMRENDVFKDTRASVLLDCKVKVIGFWKLKPKKGRTLKGKVRYLNSHVSADDEKM